MTKAAWRSVPRTFFPFRRCYALRWSENDMYGHLNNAKYHELQDSIINHYLIHKRVLQLPGASATPAVHNQADTNAAAITSSSGNSGIIHKSCANTVGICAQNGFQYFGAVAYPSTLELGLCVSHLSRIAVTYRVGVFVALPRHHHAADADLHEEEEEEGADTAIKAVGVFTHVFCDRETQRPLSGKMPHELRAALEEIFVEEPVV